MVAPSLPPSAVAASPPRTASSKRSPSPAATRPSSSAAPAAPAPTLRTRHHARPVRRPPRGRRMYVAWSCAGAGRCSRRAPGCAPAFRHQHRLRHHRGIQPVHAKLRARPQILAAVQDRACDRSQRARTQHRVKRKRQATVKQRVACLIPVVFRRWSRDPRRCLSGRHLPIVGKASSSIVTRTGERHPGRRVRGEPVTQANGQPRGRVGSNRPSAHSAARARDVAWPVAACDARARSERLTSRRRVPRPSGRCRPIPTSRSPARPGRRE